MIIFPTPLNPEGPGASPSTVSGRASGVPLPYPWSLIAYLASVASVISLPFFWFTCMEWVAFISLFAFIAVSVVLVSGDEAECVWLTFSAWLAFF